ncbi:M14 family metallopeptidase [Phyllobacterium meliloti]|uniref:M14 family metallopeptidase n=1 Tax=Phyllobacterium meliloti TaxID=555317 RepID=UPI001D137781|nr:M14 family metallopeptidase [Phyllobacterium sp. T1293]UGX88490.1 M14 family metallopeptidase [Phyllobacterium sp. T1293]
MTVIYEGGFDRTLDQLLNTYGKTAARGTRFEAWLFEDAPSRRAAEEKLAAFGVEARLRSGYKPLLHFFLEEVDLDALKSISIAYPVHENCAQNRFLLEAYPLAALTGTAELRFEMESSAPFTYDVALVYKDGSKAEHKVFAPNRIHTDFIGETLVSPTGWIKLNGAFEGTRLETDYEALFATAMRTVIDHDWGSTEPYFDELNIRATLAIADQPLPFGDEVISLREALHEDFYFSLLEVFQKKSGRPLGDRGLQPGHIVPEIIEGAGAPTLRIETRQLYTVEAKGGLQPLATAHAPIFVEQVRAELAKINGEILEAQSRAGRAVQARYHKGTDAAVMISGGQHPNESTGIVGALRSALALAKRPGAHFTVSPLENPDGYALHQRLRADNPRHMHHAARYTALGDDLEYRTGTELREKAIRVEAQRLSGAQLHINLHGYPAHEWTRPLSGYVPRGFAMWTLPKGFFLIMRHREGWEERAERFMDLVTKRLAAVPGLVAFNNEQIRLYEIHAGETGFRIINGFPCMISVDSRHDVPLTLITEYPDETIYDEAFIAGHTAQMETVLAAYDAFQIIEALA